MSAKLQEQMKQIWSQLEERAHIETYKLPEGEEVDSKGRLREMVAMSILIDEMEKVKAPEEELMDAITYCYILTNAEKSRLNFYKAYEDFHIDEYCAKYIKINSEDE